MYVCKTFTAFYFKGIGTFKTLKEVSDSHQFVSTINKHTYIYIK